MGVRAVRIDHHLPGRYARGSYTSINSRCGATAILVMDNDGSPGNRSRVLEYELDLETNVATQVWSFESDSQRVYVRAR